MPDGSTSERLLAEFEPATYATWRDAAEQELKGAPFERLSSSYREGIEIAPLYVRAALDDLPHTGSLPGQLPYVRGSRPLDPERPWTIATRVVLGDAATTARAIGSDLAGGATAVELAVPEALDPTARDLARAFEGTDLSRTAVVLSAGARGPAVAALFLEAARAAGVAPTALAGTLGLDPLGALAATGTLAGPVSRQLDVVAALVTRQAVDTPSLGTILVRGDVAHDAGAGVVDELAFALAAGSDYLAGMIDRSVAPSTAAGQIAVSLSVGPRLVLEIAKLRAARLLWARMTEAYGVGHAQRGARLFARTSRWAATRFDPWVNMLRATIGNVAAVLGGAELVIVHPFDEAWGPSDSLARRVARNTQSILAAEGHLGRVQDPTGGAYWVEHLTDQVARRAWERFQQIEAAGGLTRALGSGLVQSAIAEGAGRVRAAIAARKHVVIGVTHYPNPAEATLDRPAPANPAAASPAPTVDLALATRSGPDLVQGLDAAAASGASATAIQRALPPAKADDARVEPLAPARAAAPVEALRGRVSERGALAALVLAVADGGKPPRAASFAADTLRAIGCTVKAQATLASVDDLLERAATASEPLVVAVADGLEPGALADLRARRAGLLALAGQVPAGSAADARLSPDASLFDVLAELIDAIEGTR